MQREAIETGFVRVAACSLPVRLADPAANAVALAAQARSAVAGGAQLVVFPELSLVGYSLDDLFMQQALLDQAEQALLDLAQACADLPAAVIVGVPLHIGNRLYNCAAVLVGGEICGAVPKSYLPNYREFYERRQFASGLDLEDWVTLGDQSFLVSRRQVFSVAIPGADAAPEPSAGPASPVSAGLADGNWDALAAEPQVLGSFTLGIEICEDLWVPLTPGAEAALAGAEIVVNISGSPITVAKARERRRLCEVQSAKLLCGYVYAAAGRGESSTDLSWDGQTLIFERGELLAEGPRFSMGHVTTMADIDTALIRQDRLRQGTFDDNRLAYREVIELYGKDQLVLPAVESTGHKDGDPPADEVVGALAGAAAGAAPAAGVPAPSAESADATTNPDQVEHLLRPIDRFPFVPNDKARLDQDCYEAYSIQVSALIQRLEAIGQPKIVLGVSGGLDSSHALIVAAKAMDQLKRPRTDILAYTMPGFATAERTKFNATALATALGVTLHELDIRATARQFLTDIHHPFAHGEPVYDITFENVQAGLRTDYLFRLANFHGGIVLGTGDLSELALGWCTYGVGDQMSHYNVNGGVPKTLIQHLIRWVVSSKQFDDSVGEVLQSVVETEISPELVPSAQVDSLQSTESIVGPYALQDFALYYVLRFGLTPKQVFFRLRQAWQDPHHGEWPDAVAEEDRRGYSPAELAHWLDVFIRRFFSQQFKRSALPNGPKVVRGGTLSPRGDWRQPSDAMGGPWLAEVEELTARFPMPPAAKADASPQQDHS
ncbi:MAG: NAD(+) synthase [Bifidobacteriaceae bacterium]|nr:NAD(+) synthase [Bifidobacteriaceae bacterium]